MAVMIEKKGFNLGGGGGGREEEDDDGGIVAKKRARPSPPPLSYRIILPLLSNHCCFASPVSKIRFLKGRKRG